MDNVIQVKSTPIKRCKWESKQMEISQTSATNVNMHPLGQAIWGDIWKHTLEKTQTDATNATSSEAGDLRRQLKTHSWEKWYKCNICDFASAHVSNLRTHLETHTGEKSNKCNQCAFACSAPSSLRRHMKRHGPVQKGEKSPFVIAYKHNIPWEIEF